VYVSAERDARPLDIKLWPKEAPKAVRNFFKLCLECYYDGTIFHRIVEDFLVQGVNPFLVAPAQVPPFPPPLSKWNYKDFEQLVWSVSIEGFVDGYC